MNWKEIFKPTKNKLIILFIFIALSLLLAVFSMTPVVCITGPCSQPFPFGVLPNTVNYPLGWPFLLIKEVRWTSWINGIFIKNYFEESGEKSISHEKKMELVNRAGKIEDGILFFGLAINLFYLYLLACLFSKWYEKSTAQS